MRRLRRQGMKNALLRCETEHAFDALLKSLYTELTPGELAPLADLSLSPSDLARPHKQRFLSAQAFLAQNVVPLAARQSWHRQDFHNPFDFIRVETPIRRTRLLLLASRDICFA